MACDLNFIVEGKGLIKVTGSHVYYNTAKVVIYQNR